jgi:hypothetical protein
MIDKIFTIRVYKKIRETSAVGLKQASRILQELRKEYNHDEREYRVVMHDKSKEKKDGR